MPALHYVWTSLLSVCIKIIMEKAISLWLFNSRMSHNMYFEVVFFAVTDSFNPAPLLPLQSIVMYLIWMIWGHVLLLVWNQFALTWRGRHYYVFIFIIIFISKWRQVWYGIFLWKNLLTNYIFKYFFGSEFQMMMIRQLLERLNKERTAWIHLVIQWVGLLDCMNAMELEETRYDDNYSDCYTLNELFSSLHWWLFSILEPFSLLKVMVCFYYLSWATSVLS